MESGTVVYSLDGEYFDSMDNIQDQIGPDVKNGSYVSGYRGTIVELTHLKMLNDCRSIPEHIMDAAFDTDGDHAEEYLEDMTNEIEAGLLDVMAEYLDKHCKSPSYFRVDGIENFDIEVESE